MKKVKRALFFYSFLLLFCSPTAPHRAGPGRCAAESDIGEEGVSDVEDEDDSESAHLTQTMPDFSSMFRLYACQSCVVLSCQESRGRLELPGSLRRGGLSCRPRIDITLSNHLSHSESRTSGNTNNIAVYIPHILPCQPLKAQLSLF